MSKSVESKSAAKGFALVDRWWNISESLVVLIKVRIRSHLILLLLVAAGLLGRHSGNLVL